MKTVFSSLATAGLALAAFLLVAGCAPAGGYTSTWEVSFDRAYRSYDAVRPPMRENLLDGDGGFASAFGKLLPRWLDGILLERAVRRFRAEYPEDSASDECVRQCLKNVEIELVPSTKILTVTIRSGSRRLVDRLTGSFARALADYTGELISGDIARDLAEKRNALKKAEAEMEKMRRKTAAMEEKGESRKIVQSKEYLESSRLQADKLYPQYHELFLEVERTNRERELDRFVSYVLGPTPVAPSGVADAALGQSPRVQCIEAEKRALSEAEWRRRDWNDRWHDRLERVRLRTEVPRRKYLLAYHSGPNSGSGTENCCQFNASVDTNSALFGFLGCRFGEKAAEQENYLRLPEPFCGFTWVRHETCLTCAKLARCDSRLTFHTRGLSEVPFRRMVRVREVFEKKYGMAFVEERRGEDYFAEAYRSGGWRVGLFVTNALVKVGEADGIEYTMGFEVVNEQVLTPRIRHQEEIHGFNWRGLLHVTEVPQGEREDDDAWTYRVAPGRSTEDLLDEFCRTGNKEILKVGRGVVGTPVGWSGGCSASGFFANQGRQMNTAYQCTEWEADLVMPFTGTFIKLCDGETQARLSAKLYNPTMFRPREKGKTGEYTVGRIFCDLIPGDRVTWDSPNCRKTGTVCGEGEDGEYWGCIQKKMRDVTTIEAAREEDWTPTELTSANDRAVEDVRRRVRSLEHPFLRSVSGGKEGGTSQYIDLANGDLIATTNLLSECLARRRPGLYHAPTMEHIYDMEYRSRDYARRKVRHWENRSIERLQYELLQTRWRLLEAYFSEDPHPDGIRDDIARVFALSRFEREMLHLGRTVRKTLFPDHHSDLVVILPHHVFDEIPHVFSSAEVETARAKLEVYADRLVNFALWGKEREWITEGSDVTLAVYEVLRSAFSSTEGFAAVSGLLPRCRTLVAANLHQAPMGAIAKRLVVEFSDNPEAWKFVEGILSEVDLIERTGFVARRGKARASLAEWLSSCRKTLR